MEWDKLLRILMKALVILPPMFKLVYLFWSKLMVCSIEQLEAKFSIISPFMKKKIST